MGMTRSEHDVFGVLFNFNGNAQTGMTAREIIGATGISTASWGRVIKEGKVLGMKRCASHNRMGAYRYYIDRDSLGQEPLPVEIKEHRIIDSIEWKEDREQLVKNMNVPLDKLMVALAEAIQEKDYNSIAEAAQIIAIQALKEIDNV